MDAYIHADAPLQYATIQILPAKHKYEAYICGDNKVEKLLTGVLDHLLPYMPSLKALSYKGVTSNFKLQLPENLCGSRWFTKSTLNRFLDIVSSIELLNATKAIVDEMAQLEEARKFHVSIYSKTEVDQLSDCTRNELLRAIDSRLGALKGEFATAFCNAASRVYSATEISNLAMFSRHFGTSEMEIALHDILKMRQKSSDSVPLPEKQTPSVHNLRSVNGLQSEIPVQYSVSPAKAAEVERQNLSGSDDSSCAEDQVSAERSRASTRSASRRRSASPMRRVQIGRTGARKPAALAIRSLGYIPGRDKGFSQEDEEGFEDVDKKPELDLKRMSVQERIKIFESKQKLEQELEIEKKRALVSSASFNKSVLRRWSAGMGESSNQTQQESEQIETEDSVSEKHESVSGEVVVEADEKQKSLSQIDAEADTGHIESDADTERFENKAFNQEDEVGVEENNEKMKNTVEWSRQKEAELNQMLMKMMESGKSGKITTTQDPVEEQRGGFYDNYKQRRDEKLQRENVGKRVQKQAQFKAMQEVLSVRKAEMSSANANDTVKKQPAKKMIQKSTTKTQTGNPAKPRKETPSPTVAAPRKAASRTSPLPATRKSWPSTPPAPRTSTAGLSSAGTTPTRRKPTLTTSGSRPKPKLEKSQAVQKRSVVKEEGNVKEASRINSKTGCDNSRKLQTVSRTGSKTVNPKVVKNSADVLESKPSFYNKVTKKSSVVPLESKPMRKSPGPVPSVNKKKKGDKVIDNEVALTESRKIEQDIVIQDNIGESHKLGDDMSASFPDVVEEETQDNCELKFDEAKSIAEVENGIEDYNLETETALFPVQAEEEGPTISPMTWVDIEENDHQELSNTLRDDDDHHASEMTSSLIIAPIVSSSPIRVRHSLSQMLQEESSEADMSEWGTADNPPSMIFQKDAPKGLKRLLKFARKNKGDGNRSGWSSPSVYSEGEDDGEDVKASRSTDNLLKALHAKNFGQQKFESSYDKHLDVYEQVSASSGSHKFQEGQASSTTPTTKGSRSFFSLSAFRGGSKPSETKFR